MKRYKIMYGSCIGIVIATAAFLICSIIPRSIGYQGARNFYDTIYELGHYDSVSSWCLTPEMYFLVELFILDRLHAAITGKKPFITITKENESMGKTALRLICITIVASAFVYGFLVLREYTWFI